jgi:hypothetical protein
VKRRRHASAHGRRLGARHLVGVGFSAFMAVGSVREVGWGGLMDELGAVGRTLTRARGLAYIAWSGAPATGRVA